jgi:septal ring factor EnvC (AmiA/AmiB activator)
LAGGLVHDPFSPDSKLADSPVLTTVFTMQSTTEKKFAAVEEKLAELSGLGKKLKKLEKEVASLSKKIEAPKDWRPKNPWPASPTFWQALPACHSTRKPPRDF